MKSFTVTITEDYSDNQGNAVSFQENQFTSIADAETFYNIESNKPATETNGTYTVVAMFESEEHNEGEECKNPLENELYSHQLPSAALPKDGVIVYFQHVTYMNYAYQITEVVNVSASGCSTYQDLPYSDDHTYSTWAHVAENVQELADDYERAAGQPFDKINKGSGIIKEFLKENNPAYLTWDEDGIVENKEEA